eukprot:COSAG06_NODE_1290_length_9985_cov_3.727190_3_plen_61_part_00
MATSWNSAKTGGGRRCRKRHEVIDAADLGVIALLEGGDGRVPSNEEMGDIVNLMARFESE